MNNIYIHTEKAVITCAGSSPGQGTHFKERAYTKPAGFDSYEETVASCHNLTFVSLASKFQTSIHRSVLVAGQHLVAVVHVSRPEEIR